MFARVFGVVYRIYLRFMLRRCGVGLKVGFGAHVKGFSNIEIGNHFFSGPFLYMHTNDISDICIGNDVMLGPYVKVISGNHVIDHTGGVMRSAPRKKRGFDKGIVIGDDVWIGAGATVLDGAVISEGVVVAAGSVLSRYVPPYVIVGGIPARVIRPRFDYDDLVKVIDAKDSSLSANNIWGEYRDLGIV